MTSFLVTGGGGFVGSHLCDRLLAEGHRVVAVDDLSTGRIANLTEARGYGNEFTFFNMDIRAEGLLSLFERHHPEVLVHLAAQAAVSSSVQDPVRDAAINVMGLLNLMECCVRTGVRKVVYAASGGTLYGEARKLPVKETASGRPVSPYGISKKVGIDYLSFYERQHGIAFTALALANVYGPRQDPHGEAGVVAIFSGNLADGMTSTINGTGTQTRDYVYVKDVARANVRALEGEAPSGAYNVGTGNETSVNRVYGLLREISGKVLPPEPAPAKPGEQMRSSVDPAKVARLLGWRPQTKLAAGLEETLSFFGTRQDSLR